MKISDLKDDAALDALAEMIEPFAEIFADKEVTNAFKSKVAVKGVKPMIKNHKKAVMQILAAANGVPVEEFHCNVLTLPAMLLDLFNDPTVQDLFTLQALETLVSDASGSASATTAAREK